MRNIVIAILLAVTLAGLAAPSEARSRSSGSHSGKASGNFIVRKCKTQACLKKHPGGTYAVPLHKKTS